MMRKLLVASVVAAMGVLSACSTTSPDVVQRGDAQRLSQVQDAVILSIRPVTVDGQQSGVGAAAGGVVGAVAGSSVGGHREGAVVGVLGAVAGAMIGNAIERQGTREDALELMLQLRNGDRRAIVQAKGLEPLQVGDSVVIVTTGGKTRVTRAPNAQPVPVAPRS
jgi:outer membrane lipoprotein SlyB